MLKSCWKRAQNISDELTSGRAVIKFSLNKMDTLRNSSGKDAKGLRIMTEAVLDTCLAAGGGTAKGRKVLQERCDQLRSATRWEAPLPITDAPADPHEHQPNHNHPTRLSPCCVTTARRYRAITSEKPTLLSSEVPIASVGPPPTLCCAITIHH